MKITQIKNNQWSVLSDSGKTYKVILQSLLDKTGSLFFKWTCTCPSRNHPCKHVIAVDNEYPPYDEEAAERVEF